MESVQPLAVGARVIVARGALQGLLARVVAIGSDAPTRQTPDVHPMSCIISPPTQRPFMIICLKILLVVGEVVQQQAVLHKGYR
jgi:hypothetical protein